jgi:hypothetical protein
LSGLEKAGLFSQASRFFADWQFERLKSDRIDCISAMQIAGPNRMLRGMPL